MKEKIFIYQVLPRLFGNDYAVNKENGTLDDNGVGKFSDFDDRALSEIRTMGFTHIWYTGVLEHASKTDYSQYGIATDNPDMIKGNAGSPYAIRDYYDVTPDLADDVSNRMKEFEALIQRTHKNGLKAIIDFVPNHVARQYHSDVKPAGVKDFGENDDTSLGFSPNNNFYYIPNQGLEFQFPVQTGERGYVEYPAKVTGNDCFSNRPSVNDWYETVKLNYGVDYLGGRSLHFDPIPDTWFKMKDILLYWSSKGVDGFRCDMAEMVPVEFWNWVITEIKKEYEQLLFIAEVYNPLQYRSYVYHGFFDYLYDKVDLYDTLRDVICGYKPTSEITFSWQRVEGLQDKMLNFLENHDEQRIASDYFAGDSFKGVPGMLVAATMNTNPVMIYFGQELGERGMDKEGFSGCDGRTTIFDYWSVDSVRNWRNGGSFGNSKLTPEQIELREFYLKLIHVSTHERCIAEGQFYDLMYANYENDKFDSTKQYAFLRFVDDEFLLIVANFSDQQTKVSVHIPQEAFSFMDIDPNAISEVSDILLNTGLVLNNSCFDTLDLSLDAYSGKIIKFSLRK